MNRPFGGRFSNVSLFANPDFEALARRSALARKLK